MVAHTLRAFVDVPQLAATLVVLSPGDTGFPAPVPLGTLRVARCGGDTRAASVCNGLQWLLQHGAKAQDWVLVHDAARCLITPAQILQLMAACALDAVGGLLAHRLPDTLKQQRDGSEPARVGGTLERSDKWLAQTPQMFRIGALVNALTLAGPAVTDESSAMETAGFAPLLVEGGSLNFKVTYPEDFALAEAVLARRVRNPAQQEVA
jgi:2-C-methyl-D-erythritol 4-phosphate cytidylyltransferase